MHEYNFLKTIKRRGTYYRESLGIRQFFFGIFQLFKGLKTQMEKIFKNHLLLKK
jgi:hypothetical protein